MNALCLCAGIGAIELGLSLVADVKPVCFVESDPYCQQVLKSRHTQAFIWDDVTTFPAQEWEGVEIVTAGFPCQPWSLAGSRKGQEDERWLWPRIAEIIREVGPRYVFLENVPGLLMGGLGPVLGDLASLGLDAEWGVFSCAGMGAPQRRERVFILAYRDSESRRREDLRGQGGRNEVDQAGGSGRILAYSDRANLRNQSASNAGGSGASESGRACENLEDPDSLRWRRDLWERTAKTEGASGPLEHPESLERGQGRPTEGERERSRRSVCAESTLANPDQPRLEKRSGPAGNRPEELSPPVGGGPELAGATSTRGGRLPNEQRAINPDPRGANYAVWAPGREGDWGQIKAEFWPVEPGVCRVVNGPADRLERSRRRARLKALGNSVSAIVAAAAWVELWRRARQ